MASTLSGCETSSSYTSPLPPACSTMRRVSSAPSMSMSAMPILHPLRARTRAMARPSPEAAPVITTLLPSSFFMLRSHP